MRNLIYILISGLTTLLFIPQSVGQKVITLSLEKTIQLANDSSLESFRSKNLYLAGYWSFRSYKANRLPSLSLNMTPAQYYRDITKRYNSEQNLDVYREQQSFYASGNLSIRQNLDITGGTFYINSELGFMRNFGENTYSQITSVPIRVGYSQNLIGYNAFKWEKKIEPLRFEKNKKMLLYNMEQVSESATSYFFDLAMAQADYNLAKENVASSDTLYRTGMERYQIASISQADLLTLKLDMINARNSLENAEIALKRAMFSLASYLNIDKNVQINLSLPDRNKQIDVSIDKALLLARENNPKFLETKQSVLEAEQAVDKARKEQFFDASVNASIGFNQVAQNIQDAYRNPLQQDVVSLSISVPLVDWGVRKGRHNMARNNLNIAKIADQQQNISIEEDVTMTVGDFMRQRKLIESAEEAQSLAVMAYNETKQRFMIGKADINSLTLSHNRQQDAQRNYISTLRNYWLSYYKIRKLTLYDFEREMSLSNKFDFENGL